MLATLISNSSPQVIHPPQPPRCEFAPSSSSTMIVRPPQPCGTISESRSRTPFSIIQGFGAAGGISESRSRTPFSIIQGFGAAGGISESRSRTPFSIIQGFGAAGGISESRSRTPFSIIQGFGAAGGISESRSRTPFSIIQGFGAAGGISESRSRTPFSIIQGFGAAGGISESRSRTPFSIIQGFGAAGGARNAELSEKAASKFQPHFPAVSQDGVTVFHSPLTTGPPGRHVACSEAGPETPSGPHSAPQGRLQKDPTPGSRANTINPANCHVPGSQNPWSLYSGLTVSSQELNLASGQILPRNVCKPRLPGSHITGAASQKTTCFCRSTPHHRLPGHLATQDALASRKNTRVCDLRVGSPPRPTCKTQHTGQDVRVS
ncbi:uncharacterized protein [Gorilla gorilla gorilla]|uniref:uncharacterized protein isoform X1 n=1 Tax=Gorilla gorilla gorilla TaxID=9595 RepID=UPI00300ABEBE